MMLGSSRNDQGLGTRQPTFFEGSEQYISKVINYLFQGPSMYIYKVKSGKRYSYILFYISRLRLKLLNQS